MLFILYHVEQISNFSLPQFLGFDSDVREHIPKSAPSDLHSKMMGLL